MSDLVPNLTKASPNPTELFAHRFWWNPLSNRTHGRRCDAEGGPNPCGGFGRLGWHALRLAGILFAGGDPALNGFCPFINSIDREMRTRAPASMRLSPSR